jgi:hypothetical protein
VGKGADERKDSSIRKFVRWKRVINTAGIKIGP